MTVEEIVTNTIRIRREKGIKLPDAVIAATCLVNYFTLPSLDSGGSAG